MRKIRNTNVVCMARLLCLAADAEAIEEYSAFRVLLLTQPRPERSHSESRCNRGSSIQIDSIYKRARCCCN